MDEVIIIGAGLAGSEAALQLAEKNIKVKYEDSVIESGLRKLGSVIGDFSEIGCNSVLNPGTLLLKESFIYPLTSV